MFNFSLERETTKAPQWSQRLKFCLCNYFSRQVSNRTSHSQGLCRLFWVLKLLYKRLEIAFLSNPKVVLNPAVWVRLNVGDFLCPPPNTERMGIRPTRCRRTGLGKCGLHSVLIQLYVMTNSQFFY